MLTPYMNEFCEAKMDKLAVQQDELNRDALFLNGERITTLENLTERQKKEMEELKQTLNKLVSAQEEKERRHNGEFGEYEVMEFPKETVMVACSCSESFDKLNSSLSTHSSFEDVTVLTEGVRQMTSSECIKKPTYAESYLGELRYSYPEGVVEEVRPSSPEDLAATTKKLAEIFGIEPSEVAMPPKKTYSDGFDRKSIAELFGLPYTEDVPTPSFIEETPTLEKVEEVSKLNQSVEEGYVNKEETSEERSQAARRPAVRYSDKFILILVFGLVFTHISQFVGFLSPYFAIFFNSVLYVFSEVCQFCSKNRTSTFLFGIATAAVFYPLHVIAILYVEIILKLIWCLWPGLWYNFDMCE